jgi:hypothetical protein
VEPLPAIGMSPEAIVDMLVLAFRLVSELWPALPLPTAPTTIHFPSPWRRFLYHWPVYVLVGSTGPASLPLPLPLAPGEAGLGLGAPPG